MSADSPRRSSGGASHGMVAAPVVVPPQVVSDRSILDSAIGFINEVTLAHQPFTDPKDTITWARFETAADISDPRFGDDWELEGNVAPPLLLILGYGMGVQVWAIPANGEAIEVLSWRHGIVSALKILPTPTTPIPIDENGRADEPTDAYAEKRPLIALVDGNSSSGSQPQFCAVNFVSLKTGTQVKTIQFKNPVVDILANRSSIAITFHERIAVFDARTLEDRLSITTCYPSPGINPNPAALGQRWLAYAENKLLHSKRSGGGCDGDGVASYTATVLNASKSLVKGLRELGEQVAAGLTGTTGTTGNFKSTSFDSGCGVDSKQSGIVTIIDVKHPTRDYSPTSVVPLSSNQTAGTDAIIAHFVAHSEALVAMEFDNSGMILVTADRRGHDFHVFRIQPNPVGPSLAAVHHLYILHRGDTSAKVQNITLSLDSRWVAVSTLRGTTHVFPITPYGGTMGVRTHTSLHVVNKLSRFHRSAGLSADGRSNSPISHSDSTTFTQSLQPYHNPTLPPFPRPTIVIPLAQLRQPFALGSPPGSAALASVKSVAGVSSSGSQRQRLSSLSDDNGKPLSVCAIFAKSRSWLLEPPNVTREAPHRMQRKAVDSLFVMAGHGALIQYDLDTKLASNIAREKICDDTPIELEVEAKAQWNLGRRKEGSQDIMPPLSCDNWLIKSRNSCMLTDSTRQFDERDDRSDSWLAQVEIITHAGPHRRLWMGPQFVFKTYNTPSGSNLSHVDIEAVEIGTAKAVSSATTDKLEHSSPLNMPLSAAGRSSAVPVLIESGSYSSIEQSPKLMDRFRHDHLDSDFSLAHGDSRLKEDLADAMRESPSVSSSSKETGGHGCDSAGSNDNVAFYDALTAQDDQEYVHARSISAAALATALPNIHSYNNSSSFESLESIKKPKASIEKIVNPLGTVTTVTSCLTADVKTDILDEVVSQLATEENIIHENCDESLFRPVVAIFCDEKTRLQNEKEIRENSELCQPPETISNRLVVPVIPKEIDDEISKKEKKKIHTSKAKVSICKKSNFREVEPNKFVKLSTLHNTKPNEDDANSKEKDASATCNQLSLLNSMEKQNLQSLKVENINRKDKKDCIKRLPASKSDVLTKEKNNDGIKSIKAESIKVVHSEEMHCEKIKENPIELKRMLTKPQGSKDELENCEIPDANTNTKEITKNIKTKTKSLKDGKHHLMEDVKKENQTLKPEENVKIQFEPKFNTIITANIEEEENELETTEKCIQKSSEMVSTTSLIANKSVCIDKNAKKENLDKEKEKEKEIVNKSKNIVICDELENDLKERKSYEDKPSTSSSKTDKVNAAQSNVADITSTSRKLSIKSNVENEEYKIRVIDRETKNEEKKVSTTSTIGELKECELSTKATCLLASSSTDEIKPSIKDLNRDQKNKETITSKSDSKDVKKSVDEGKSKTDIESVICESREKSNKKSKSETDSIRKTLDNVEGKSPVIDTTKPFALEKPNISKQSHYEQESKGKSDSNTSKSTSSSSRPIKSDEMRKEKVISEQKSQSQVQIDSEIKNEPADVNNKNNQKHIRKETKDDIKKIVAKDLELKDNNKFNTSVLLLPKKNASELSKDEQEIVLNSNAVRTVTVLEAKKEKIEGKFVRKSDKPKPVKPNSKDKELIIEDTATNSNDNQKKDDQQKKSSPIAVTSAWKTLSGAEMINKNITKSCTETNKNFSLEASNKSNAGRTETASSSDKLLPELPTPNDMIDQITKNRISNKTKISFALKDDPHLNPLEALPPLPSLEPLQLISENKSGILRDISLINFESPLQENPALQRKITPPPRGFTEQNLIFALCGSLHYENENVRSSPEKLELSPTFSSNRSSTAVEEPSTTDYKSLTENDDLYMSLEQSSQDTNTTNTNTTNEKFSSSTNSSGSEEIVIVEEKKMSKKQKRKRQQLQELQNQKEQQHQQEMDDEELRPLIAMTESQADHISSEVDQTLPEVMDNSNSNKNSVTQTFLQSTTTDSEGPLPATTSDDNVFCLPAPMVHNPQKIKTKKLEHKINLIGAIEAATSSSTSSAEESGVEIGGRSPHDNEESLISLASNTSAAALPLAAGSVQATAGALKKKRIQFHKDHLGKDNVDGSNNLKITPETFDTQNSNVSTVNQSLDESKNKNKNIQDMHMHTSEQEMSHTEFQSTKQKQQLQYLTTNAIENCFATDESSSTIINIDIFDDQLSGSSNSNTSRFSCEATPLNTTTPPLSLNGVINTNLMHFSPNSVTPSLSSEDTNREANLTSEDHNNIIAATKNTRNDNCDNDDVNSMGSGGSL